MKNPFLNEKRECRADCFENTLTLNVDGSKFVEEDNTIKFLYDHEDLFETMLSIKHPNVKAQCVDVMLGLIKFPIPTPTLNGMKERLSELSSGFAQVGLDDLVTGEDNLFLLHGHIAANAVVWAGSYLDARLLLRRGVVPSIRPLLWRRAFGLEAHCSSIDDYNLNNLIEECHTLDVATDELLVFDVNGVVDDPKFFVFEVPHFAIYKAAC